MSEINTENNSTNNDYSEFMGKMTPKQKDQSNKKNEPQDFILRFQRNEMVPTYNALTDKYLMKYFQNLNIRNNLLKVGLINEQNQILETRQQIPKQKIKLDPIEERKNISHIIKKTDLQSNDPSKLLGLHNSQKQYQYKKLPPLKTQQVVIKGTLPDLYLRTNFQKFAQQYLQKSQRNCQSESKVIMQDIEQQFLKNYKNKYKRLKVQKPLYVTYQKLKAKINNQPFDEKIYIEERRKGASYAYQNLNNFYNNKSNHEQQQDEYYEDEFEKDDDEKQEEQIKKEQQQQQQKEKSKQKNEEEYYKYEFSDDGLKNNEEMSEKIDEKPDDVNYQSDEFDLDKDNAKIQEDINQKNQDNSQTNTKEIQKSNQIKSNQQDDEQYSEEYEEMQLDDE